MKPTSLPRAAHSLTSTPRAWIRPTLAASAQTADKCNVFWQTHALDAYHLRAPEQLEVKAHDGTTLYATLLLPEGAQTPATVPLIVNPYGGPGAQTVVKSLEQSERLLFDELLAQHGFAVLHADNRGMGGRGRAFAQAAYRNFGPVQLEDQLTVRRCRARQVSATRSQAPGLVGMELGRHIHALRHDALRPLPRRGCCGAGDRLAQLRLHLHRALSGPAGGGCGGHISDFSVVNSAANLKGRLLLVHGTGDDNVHMENTVQFVQKLIEAGIPYDLQIYPRKTHSIAGPDVRTTSTTASWRNLRCT